MHLKQLDQSNLTSDTPKFPTVQSFTIKVIDHYYFSWMRISKVNGNIFQFCDSIVTALEIMEMITLNARFFWDTERISSLQMFVFMYQVPVLGNCIERCQRSKAVGGGARWKSLAYPIYYIRAEGKERWGRCSEGGPGLLLPHPTQGEQCIQTSDSSAEQMEKDWEPVDQTRAGVLVEDGK